MSRLYLRVTVWEMVILKCNDQHKHGSYGRAFYLWTVRDYVRYYLSGSASIAGLILKSYIIFEPHSYLIKQASSGLVMSLK